MIRLLSFLAAFAAPMPALALSCVPHSMEASFQQAAASAESYLVVHGRLTFDAKKLPKGLQKGQQQSVKQLRVPARLEGQALNAKGFVVPFAQNVTLALQCLGPWCPSAQPGQDVLAFVRKAGDGFTISLDPCAGDLFGMPDAAMLRKVKQCYDGADCRPPNR